MADREKRRRGLGGLTPEKKALLKKIIMEKAREEMHNESLRKKEAKEKIIMSKVIPVEPKGMKPDDLKELCRQLHKAITIAEGDKYDLEQKLNKQERDIHELTMKIQLRGKFAKPVLRKVKREDTMLSKIRQRHAARQREQDEITAELHHVEK